MDEIKKMVQSLTYSVKTIETNMTTFNLQFDLCVDMIEKMDGKHDDGSWSEVYNKGNNVYEEEGDNHDHLFSDHSHNMMPCIPKVDMCKFDRLNLTIWGDQT